MRTAAAPLSTRACPSSRTTLGLLGLLFELPEFQQLGVYCPKIIDRTAIGSAIFNERHELFGNVLWNVVDVLLTVDAIREGPQRMPVAIDTAAARLPAATAAQYQGAAEKVLGQPKSPHQSELASPKS